MKFLAMHITNQKLSFNIFTVGNLPNIFITSVPLCYSVAMATYLFFHSGTVLPCSNIDIFSIYSKTVLDNVDLWIKICNLLTKDDAKKSPLRRDQVNRAISGALLQQVCYMWGSQWGISVLEEHSNVILLKNSTSLTTPRPALLITILQYIVFFFQNNKEISRN